MLIEALLQDFRLALRQLRRSPVYAAAAVATLAVGIGANTAMFTVVESVVWRPPAYSAPERLVALAERLSPGDFADLQRGATSFAEVGAFSNVSASLTTAGGEPERVAAASVSSNWFRLLGRAPMLGRSFAPEDERETGGGGNGGPAGAAARRGGDGGGGGRAAGEAARRGGDGGGGGRAAGEAARRGGDGGGGGRAAEEAAHRGGDGGGGAAAARGGAGGAVVVLGHGLWQRRFGADPAVLGRALRINGKSFTVVGVMPADLDLVSDEDLWLPLDLSPAAWMDRDQSYLRVWARLRPGVTPAAAQAELDAVAGSLARLVPASDAGLTLHLVPLQRALAGAARSPLLLLLGAVGFLMVLACANLTHLELARAAACRQQAAIRVALGAGRADLLRERLAGAVLLALVGGGCGVGLALWGTRLLASLAADLEAIPRLAQTHADGRVLVFALVLSLGSAFAFGLLPALDAARADVQSLLVEAQGRVAGGGRRRRYLRSALSVSELALALVLLVGSALLLESFRSLLATPPGFRAANCVAMRVVLPREAPAAAETAFTGKALDNLRSLPGIAAAGVITNLPLTTSRQDAALWIEGRPAPPAGREPVVDLDSISPGYLEAMGTPLLAGRAVLPTDRAGTPAVAVVNRALAARFWPGGDPLGKRFSLAGPAGPWVTVAGVAGDVKRHGLDLAVEPQVYLPFEQQPAFFVTFVVRTTGDPRTVAAGLRGAVHAADPAQAVAWVRPMAEVVSASVGNPRFVTLLLTLFAAIALVLATVGMYGVMAHSVSQRRQELAVRLALGARRADLLRLVLGNALALIAAGLALGLGAFLALSKLLTSFVFGVSATDPLTLAAVSLLVAGTALVSAWLPARRAARVAPGAALKPG